MIIIVLFFLQKYILYLLVLFETSNDERYNFFIYKKNFGFFGEIIKLLNFYI